MLTHFRVKVTSITVVSVLAAAISGIPALSWAQTAGDIVVVGNSSPQWEQFRSYWNQLLNLNSPTQQPDQTQQSFGQPVASPQVLEQQLMRNLRVSGLRLVPIIKLNGSSQVLGTLTNGNQKAVTVSGVNFEVLDSNGNLLETGSATPEPTTLGPGQSVTFKATLLTVLPDVNNQIRLARPAFVLQGGV
jgi:hypothetical protein